ncbi:serine protease snake [Helicoverpa armigera]|uniref:serine protease snake n=1 Tax=Helicoverpa armigera TaxID=29058 RepID=UPI003082FF6D
MRNIVYPKFCSMDVFVPTLCCKQCKSVDNSSEPEAIMRGAGLAGVVGGFDAEGYKYRHMALLGYGEDPKNAMWLCAGSIISDYYILTAAHCTSSPISGIKFAALGVLRRTDDFHMWQIYDIAQVIPYPDYEPPSMYDDIALLETTSRIRYNAEVAPACLYKSHDIPDIAAAAGWVDLANKQPVPEHLQIVYMTKFSDEECRRQFPRHEHHLQKGYDNVTQACYADIYNFGDTCEGESGGPLQVKTENSKKSVCEHTIFGITSFGKTCGAGVPGMYTRVSHYVPWIESHTKRLP